MSRLPGVRFRYSTRSVAGRMPSPGHLVILWYIHAFIQIDYRMVRTVLVDDEVDSILVLRKLLEVNCPEVEVVAEADGVAAALDVIEKYSPDLLLLDIAMNNGNAFDLLNQLDTANLQVIFVTAFDTHAIEAFKYSAVDYLLKPVHGDHLRTAVEKAVQKSKDKGVVDHLKVLLNNISALQLSQQKMAIPTMNGLTFIFLKDILRLEAEGSYTTVHLSDGKRIVTTRGIKEFEGLLPENLFYRVHNSHIINLNKVQEYQKGRGGYILMEDNTSIEVAIRRREEFLKKMLK
jgi:two-component system LytT family response regulator